MPIYVKAAPSYPPAPEGTHAAVCVDVVDLGMIKSKFYDGKLEHKIRIIWQLDVDRDDGKPFQVSKRYTASLHEKATLRKHLESWRSRAFNQAELEQFDLENLLGVPALLNIIHEEDNGKPYANIASLMKLPKSMSAPTQREYVRVCDRKPKESYPVGAVDKDDEDTGVTDEDIPF